MSLMKSTVLAAAMVAGVALAAQAQTGPSVASMPAPGPKASSEGYQGPYNQTAVPQSPAYPGPNAGAGNGVMPPRYQKPAGWDANPNMHPYDMGPRPN